MRPIGFYALTANHPDDLRLRDVVKTGMLIFQDETLLGGAMKRGAIITVILIASICQADSCRYGLGTVYGSETCYQRESEALRLVAAAKTTCNSANSEVRWRKDRKMPSWAWDALHAGSAVAVKGFVSQGCARADQTEFPIFY
jgi:hypothetical protein